MKKAKNYLLAASGLVMLLGSFVLSVPKASDAQNQRNPQPVTVENREQNPVPVAVLNRVRVCPDQDCPAMTLNANDRNAFQKSVPISIPKGQFGAGTDVPVPAGKRLVIEFVTALHYTISPPTSIELRTQVNGDDADFALLETRQSVPNVDLWITTQQVRVYADAPGFRVEAGREGPFLEDAFAQVSISGYLVDL
jgi:hypothetical protein